jgi:hypothetical protein
MKKTKILKKFEGLDFLAPNKISNMLALLLIFLKPLALKIFTKKLFFWHLYST